MATEPVSCLRASHGDIPLRRFGLAAAMALCLSPLCLPAAAQTLAPETAPQVQPQGLQQEISQQEAPQQPQIQPPPQVQPPAAVIPQPAAPAIPPVGTSQPAAPVPEQVQTPAAGAAPDGAAVEAGGEQQQGLEPQAISPAIPQEGATDPQSAVTETEILPQLPSLFPPDGEEGLHDLSPWGMYLQADIVVKAVMIGLAFASLVTWTVWLAKSLELFFARRRARKGLEVIRRSQTLAESEATFRVGRSGGGTLPKLVAGALDEAQRSGDLPAEGIKERAGILLSRIEARAGRRMSVGTGLLATIGSTAPFVGLFGTVWGIMNSFIGIAKSNTTNLAVVAPGIAEALLATAIGLVAAIPAVIIYNMFARSIAGYRALLGDASAEVLRHLSRDLDRAAANSHRKPAPVTSLRSAAE